MPTPKIVPLPQCFACFCIQTRRPKTAEMQINSAMLDYGRRRRITVHRSAVTERLRVIAMEQFFIEADFSRLLIDADRKEILAVFGRRGQPYLAVHYYGSSPAL